jgi:hypothetical protein
MRKLTSSLASGAPAPVASPADRAPVPELGHGGFDPVVRRVPEEHREEATPGYLDHGWAFELAHVVDVLGDRLQQATQSLRELRTAHDNLVWGLYQGNETFVVARR